MKREEAMSNAMQVIALATEKKLGYIRTYSDYECEIWVMIHFKKMNNDIYEAKEEISSIIIDGTKTEIYSNPRREYERLDYVWTINEETEVSK